MVCVCVPCSVSSLPFALLCVYQRAAVGRCPYMCQVVRLGSTVQHVHVLPVARACVFQFEKRPHPTPLLPALPCVAHALVSVLIVPCIVLGVVAVVVSCVCRVCESVWVGRCLGEWPLPLPLPSPCTPRCRYRCALR